MATKTLKTKIIMRNDTAENWRIKNPTLDKGEIGVESDTHKFKIGDNATAWNDLGYAGADEAVIENIIAQNRDNLYKYTRTDVSQSDSDAIAAALGGKVAVQGDIVVITTTIEGNTDDALRRRNYNSIADAQHPKSNNGEYKSTNLNSP